MAHQTFPWTYFAYGLRLKSAIQIPNFLSATDERIEGVSDSWVSIYLDRGRSIAEMIPQAVLQKSIAVQGNSDGIILYLRGIAVFQIQQGHTIHCYPASQSEEHQISSALSGVVMAALLFQRGCFIAHASAVSMAGQGVLFLGDSGAGKSSLAIALHQQGYPIVTDDLAVMIQQEGRPHLLPAFPQMRVTQDTAQSLQLPWDDLIHLPNIPKRGFRFEAEFDPKAIPLRHIYILKPSVDNASHCVPIDGPQKIMELMHHSEVMSLFQEDKTLQFKTCATFAQAVPIDTFQRPMNWDALPDALSILETHVSAGTKTPSDEDNLTEQH